MIYEIAISLGSILFSFVLFYTYTFVYQTDDDDVIFDRRDDLTNKELLMVNVVRANDVIPHSIEYFTLVPKPPERSSVSSVFSRT